MKRVLAGAVALLVAGCGIQPSGVTEAGTAPTGVAPGVTLYFVDAAGRLVPQVRETGQLGTPTEALSLLLATSAGSGLHTEIKINGTTRVFVQTTPGLISLLVPLDRKDFTRLGVDQLVCTAVAAVVQDGASRRTKVTVDFTHAPPGEQNAPRTCPVIG